MPAVPTIADHKGKLISIDANCITVAHSDGSHHTRSVTAATICKGKKTDLADLKPGDEITVVGDPVTSIIA